jgi:hypothetical protein
MRPIEWTADMIAAFLRLRRAGHNMQICADVIGVDCRTANKKARELGIAQRMNRGYIPGHVVKETSHADHHQS